MKTLWQDERRRELHERISRLTPETPAFGPLSARGWGVLTYRHLDHHLLQFGV